MGRWDRGRPSDRYHPGRETPPVSEGPRQLGLEIAAIGARFIYPYRTASTPSAYDSQFYDTRHSFVPYISSKNLL